VLLNLPRWSIPCFSPSLFEGDLLVYYSYASHLWLCTAISCNCLAFLFRRQQLTFQISAHEWRSTENADFQHCCLMDASRQLTWSSTHHRLSLKIISPVLVLSAYSIISPPKPGRCRSLVLLSDDAHWNKTRSPGPGPWGGLPTFTSWLRHSSRSSIRPRVMPEYRRLSVARSNT